MKRLLPLLGLLGGAVLAAAAQGSAGGRPAEPLPEVRIEPGASSQVFRFLPGGELLSLDRPLFLSAAPGEIRSYSLELGEAGRLEKRDFVIDRRPPSPPIPSLPSGFYEDGLDLSLSTESGATVFFSLSGPERAFPSFAAFDPSKPLRLAAPPAATATWILVAFCVDSAGNRGEEAVFTYRVAPRGFSVETRPPAPGPGQPRADASIDPGKPQVQVTEGTTRLVLPAPPEGRWAASVAPGPALGRKEAWADLASEGKQQVLTLECPYGWSGSLPVYLGLDSPSGIAYRPLPFLVDLAYKGLAAGQPATPDPPLVIQGPSGGLILSFPPYVGQVHFSIDGAPPALFTGPLPVETKGSTLSLRWTGTDSRGQASPEGQKTFTLARSLEGPLVSGLEGPSLRSQALHLSPAGDLTIRYEMSGDGSIPKEPTVSSPLLGEELVLDALPGTTRGYKIRFRPFSDETAGARAGESFVQSVTVDREPPRPPRILGATPTSWSSKPLAFKLQVPEGRLLVSLTEGRGPEDWKESGPDIELGDSIEGPRIWTFSARTRDEAGNLSAPLGPLRFVVDSASLYVDASAQAPGDGSPGKPYASLSEALAGAQALGKKVLLIRGEASLSAPLALVGRDLVLRGGFGPDWTPSPSARSRLVLPASAPSSPALALKDSTLLLGEIELAAPASAGSFVSLEGSSLRLRGSSLALSSSGSLVLLSLRSSKLALADTVLSLSGPGGALVSARDSEIAIDRSDLGSAETSDYFTGLVFEGGSLALRDSRLVATARLSLVGIRGSSGDLLIDRSELDLRAPAGYLRCASLDEVRGEARNSHFLVRRDSAATLFELRKGDLSFVHDSFLAEGGEGLLFLDNHGARLRLVNDLFLAGNGGASLLASELPPAPGFLVSCAFQGFSSYLSGAVGALDPAAFARYIAGPSLPPSRFIGGAPVIQRAPKGGLALTAGSAPVDNALALGEAVYALDFSGQPRPSAAGRGLPDIGADELP